MPAQSAGAAARKESAVTVEEIERNYGDIISGSLPFRAEVDAIKQRRHTDPGAAATRAALLKQELEPIRLKNLEGAERAGREVEDFVAAMEEEGATEVKSRRPGKTAGSTAPVDDPLAQDIGLNIDEILPVGDRNATLAERRRRALSLDNREFKEQLTNQRSKHVGTDSRDLEPRGPESVSLRPAGEQPNPSGSLFGRRFSEIDEMRAIGEKALSQIKGKTTRAPGALKEELNQRIWKEIHKPTTKEGEIVADALARGGFGVVTGSNGKMMLRALTESELTARGMTFVKGEGWIKAK